MVQDKDREGDFVQPKTVAPKVFKYLKRYAEQCEPHERMVVLSFNTYPFNHFVNVNPDRRQYGELLPSHCVIPCIRFVCDRRFHFLGSLFFYREHWENNKTKFSKDLSECIKLYILALANSDLTVVATVTPSIDSFIRAIQILSHIRYLEQFYGIIHYDVGPTRDIFHIHDPTHVQNQLVKLFLHNDFHFQIYGKKYRASKDDIMEALRLDSKPLIYRDPEAESLDQGESIGEYYLSEEMGESIRKHMKTEALPREALGTRLFIGNVRAMFHEFYSNSDFAKYNVITSDRTNYLIHFINSIELVQNKTSIEYLRNQKRVDPRKSKMVRNLKDIDAYIEKTKSGKYIKEDSAEFKETAKKLEYDIYSEMCNTPDYIQPNPKTSSGKTSAGKSSAGQTSSTDSPKTKRKKAGIPADVRKELIRARLAASEGSKEPTTPTKQKGPLGKTQTLSTKKDPLTPTKQKGPMAKTQQLSTKKDSLTPTKQKGPVAKTQQLSTKRDSLTPPKQKVPMSKTQTLSTKQELTPTKQELTPTKKSVDKSNTDSPNSKHKDQASTRELTQSSKNKNQKKSEEQSHSTKDETKHKQLKDSNQSKPKSSPVETLKNKKENKIIFSQVRSVRMPIEDIETEKQEDEPNRRSPEDLEVSEALILLSDQPQEYSKTDEFKATAGEFDFDDLPDLVEDSSDETDTEEADSDDEETYSEDEETDSEFEDLIMKDIMDEAKADFEKNFSKKENRDSFKEAVAQEKTQSTEKASAEAKNTTNAENKTEVDTDAVPDLVADSDTIDPKKETENMDNKRIQTTNSTKSEMDNAEPSGSLQSDEVDIIPLSVRNLEATISSIEQNEEDLVGILEKMNISKEDIEAFKAKDEMQDGINLGQAQKKLLRMGTDIFKINANKLTAAEISGSSQSENPDSHFETSYFDSEDHSYARKPRSKSSSMKRKGKHETKKDEDEEKINKDERKHLSPLQTGGVVKSPSSGSKKKVDTLVDKVKALKFDNESDKENSEESGLLSPDTKPAPSISDKERNLRIALGVEDKIDDFEPERIVGDIGKEAIGVLVDKYLTREQIEEVFCAYNGVEPSSQLDSVVDSLSKTNEQNTEMTKSLKKEQLQDTNNKNVEDPENVFKISWQDSSTVSIEKVDRDSIKPPPKDPFKKTDLRDLDIDTKNDVDTPKDLNEGNEDDTLSEISTETASSIPDFPDEFDDDAGEWGLADDQVKLLAEYLDEDIRAGSNRAARLEAEKSSNNSTANENPPPSKEINKKDKTSLSTENQPKKKSDTSTDNPPPPPKKEDTTSSAENQPKKKLDTSTKTPQKKEDETISTEKAPTQEEIRQTGAIKRTYERKTKDSETVREDFKCWISFKKFVNAICQFLKKTSRKYHLPYTPDVYLEKVVEESEKLFHERRTIDSKIGWRIAVHSYIKLFRTILGPRLFDLPNIKAELQVVIRELELFVMATKNADSIDSMKDEDLMIKNLWVQNLWSIKELFLQLRGCEVFDELAPDLFRTDHVTDVMRHVLKFSNDPSSFQYEEDCEPLDVRECFDNLRAYGSILLVE